MDLVLDLLATVSRWSRSNLSEISLALVGCLLVLFGTDIKGWVEQRLGGAHRRLVGRDRLGQLAAELAARQHPGGERPGGEPGEKRQQNDSIHQSQRCARAWTCQPRQYRVNQRSVTAPTNAAGPGVDCWRRPITRL